MKVQSSAAIISKSGNRILSPTHSSSLSTQPGNNLVHGMVRRSNKSKTPITFSLEGHHYCVASAGQVETSCAGDFAGRGGGNHDDNNSVTNTTPLISTTSPTLMYARRCGNPLSNKRFLLFDAKSDARIGYLEHARSDLTAHAYCLKREIIIMQQQQQQQRDVSGRGGDEKLDGGSVVELPAAWIVYRVPKITTLVTGTNAHRYVELALPPSLVDDDDDDGNENFGDDSHNETTTKGRLVVSSGAAPTNTPPLHDVAKGIRIGNWNMTELVAVLKSIEPQCNKDGKMGLNFKGRGRMTSNKNIQLMNDGSACLMNSSTTNATENCGSTVVVTQPTTTFQMAKWEENVFHVDFRAPMTPFLAFGMALAQMDL